MKMRLNNLKNGSQRYDKNRARPRYGHKYTKSNMSQYGDYGYVQLAKPKQHLKLNS